MRKHKYMVAVSALCLCLVWSLYACSHESKVVGAWQGDGTLDMREMEAPYEFADRLTFRGDGTVIVEVDSVGEQYTYGMTDDTLTLTPVGGGLSWGVAYQLEGDTLTIKTGGAGSAVFVKID